MFSKKFKSLLKNSENRHTAFTSLYALFIKGAGAVTALFFNLVISRMLGAEEAGYFFICLSIVMILSVLCQLGFENAVLRFTSAYSDQPQAPISILNFALKLSLPVSFCVAIFIYAFADKISSSIFNNTMLADTLRFISPSIIGLSSVFILAMSLQARRKLTASIPCQSIVHFIICGSLVYLLSVKSAEIVSLLFSLSLLISAVFYYFYSTKTYSPTNASFTVNKDEFFKSARASWVISSMNQIIIWLSPILIGIYLSSQDVAFFSIAQRVSLLISFVLMAVNLVVAPKFASLHSKGDLVGIRNTALFSVKLLLMSGLPLVFLILIFSANFMAFFGEEFKQGAVILQILAVGQGINVITGSVSYLLMMSGHERDMRFVTVLCGVGVLISVPIFTKLFGAIGAASATAFFISLQNLLAVYFVKKRLGFNTLKFWQKI